jgi:hypothetical protein
MPADKLFADRRLRLCYWNAEARVLDAERAGLEQHLARLGDVSVVQIKALDAPEATPCDLLIVAAQTLAPQDFPSWLAGFRRRIQAQGMVWTPALILADVSFDVLSDILPDVTRENWYFDILAPAHVTSLPIRVANLLRIHDHLHEMKRYATALEDIGTKVTTLETQLEAMKKAGKSP